MRPIFEEVTTYGKKQNTLTRKEDFRKVSLFRVTVRGMSYEESKQIVHELRQSLYRPSGYIGLRCLSEVDEDHPAEYNEEEKIYEDFICIPKDTTNPKEQMKAVIQAAAMKIYEIKCKHMKRCRAKLQGK